MRERYLRQLEQLHMEMLQQQPVAGDLRKISAARKLISDLERIGDHATNVAEWVEYTVTGVHPRLN